MRFPLLLVAAGALAACSPTPDGPVTETGSLQNGDATLTSGEYADRFTVRLNEGQWLRATLDSDTFDPYLVVRFPNGQQSDLDDSTPGDTTTVTMLVEAQESGQFEIIATSYSPGSAGAYRLTYEVLDAEPPATPSTTDAAPTPSMGTDARPDARPDAPSGDAGSNDIEEKPGEGADSAPPPAADDKLDA